MKNYLLLFICCLILKSVLSQDICLPEMDGTLAQDHPPGCFMCGPTYQGSTEGFTPDFLGIDFPCGTIDNSQWISLFPDQDGLISITPLISNCENSQGIEALLYDSDFNPVSDCFSSNGGVISTLIVNDLNPLERYHLMIDGVAGDICEILLITTFDVKSIVIDTVICPGSCLLFKDSCYYESTNISFSRPCLTDIRFNISPADTGNFEISQLIDSFTNSISFNWNVLGADSFDIFIDDVFQISQKFSSFLIPITLDLKDSFNFRVVPRSDLGCSFKTSVIDYPSGRTYSGIDKQNLLKNSITISPNPSKGIFKINSKRKILETAVFDLNGKKIMVSKTNILDLSAFDNSIYFLKIRTDLGVNFKKVLKI